MWLSIYALLEKKRYPVRDVYALSYTKAVEDCEFTKGSVRAQRSARFSTAVARSSIFILKPQVNKGKLYQLLVYKQ